MPALSRRAAFTLLCAATLAEFLTLGMFLAALPLFLDERLDASRFAVGGIVAAFSISALALRPVIGRQTDRRGRKWFLVAAPVILLASSAGLATARSLAAVAALRLLQGCAGAAFYTAAATMATDLAPADRRASYIARLSLFIYGGFAVGPTVAEALVRGDSFGPVWIATAATATVALVCTVLLPETLAEPSKSTAGLRLVHPASIAPGLVLLTAAVGYSTISTFSPLYARSIGMTSSGPLYLAFAITIIGVRLVSGTLADRYGRLTVALPGMLTAAAGLVILATTPAAVIAMAGVAAFGAGFALVFPALMAFRDFTPSRPSWGPGRGRERTCA